MPIKLTLCMVFSLCFWMPGIVLSQLPGKKAPKLPLKGRVMGANEKGKVKPLAGAAVYVLPHKVGTLTDSKGYFELSIDPTSRELVTSFVGFMPDTLDLTSPKSLEELQLVLQAQLVADSVIIEARTKSTGIDLNGIQLIEDLGRQELLKAACCNLGESFETNASVDVNYPDAVSGTKQIQLLGLTGPYTQYTLESMPELRGLASGIGLDYIPGTWIDGIQISKGTGSVVNGYESFSGQINVELQKPQTGDILYVNTYLNQGGRIEVNGMSSQALGKGGVTALGHYSTRPIANDQNQDGFVDFPLTEQYNGLVRFYFSNGKSLEGQAGVHYVNDRRRGGQLSWWDGPQTPGSTVYALDWKTQHLRFWTKTGWVNPRNRRESIGLQLSTIFHEQDRQRITGMATPQAFYQGRQQTYYANLIYQNILWNTNHQIRLGASFLGDLYDEAASQVASSIRRTRSELIPGTFAEYTYKYLDTWRVVAGLRADYHNLWGFFMSPRMHFLYRPSENWSLRLSGGRGQRTANVWSDAATLELASNRKWEVDRVLPQAYGLPPEVAWNLGANVTYNTRLAYRPLQIRGEYFYTYFEQMTIFDRDLPMGTPLRGGLPIRVYALDGLADAHSVQFDLSYEPHRRVEVRTSVKRQVARITYQQNGKSNLLNRPFLPAWRAMINGSYKTRNQWAFDLTGQLIGPQRLPNTAGLPLEQRLDDEAPGFFLLSGQISKGWGKEWYVYLGAENLLNFTQPNPIVAADDPSNQYFNATRIWGPVFGRMIYLGLNYRIEKKKKV